MCECGTAVLGRAAIHLPLRSGADRASWVDSQLQIPIRSDLLCRQTAKGRTPTRGSSLVINDWSAAVILKNGPIIWRCIPLEISRCQVVVAKRIISNAGDA